MVFCKPPYSLFPRLASALWAPLCLTVVLLSAQPLQAQQSAPLAVPTDAARAESLRREADAIRDAAEISLASDEAACLGKWLVNNCRDKARERYLLLQQKHRALSAEAAAIEQEIRRRELAERDALLEQRRAELPAVQAASAPAAASAATARPTAKPMPPASAPRTAVPTARPITPVQRSERQIESLSERAAREQEAALRAQQARETAARYEKRRAEVAARKAKRRANESSPAALPGR